MNVLKNVTDFFYRTGRVKNKFSNDFPEEKVLAADASKALLSKGTGKIKWGVDWVTSQRAVVLLTDRRIKYGYWDIPLEEVERAQLVKVNSLFGSGQILKITTCDNYSFQFGMQRNREWTDQSVLPITLEKGKLQYSLLNMLSKVIIVGFLVYFIAGKMDYIF